MNPLVVTFRAVGIYCYLPKVEVNVAPGSTVSAVMRAIASQRPLHYRAVRLSNGKIVIDQIGYTFNDSSITPPNSSRRPANGYRDMANNLQIMPSLVWQYYRSVTGTINGYKVTIELPTYGQPSFVDLALDSGKESLPPSFVPSVYNLTWRLVQLQLSPEKAADFQAAKQNVVPEVSAQPL